MDGRTFCTLELEAGRNRKKDPPPERQDLAEHLAQAKEEFEKGALLGDSPLDLADAARIQAIVDKMWV